MKNKFIIRANTVAVYFLVGVLSFLMINDENKHFVVVTGLIGVFYTSNSRVNRQSALKYLE